MGAGLSPPPGAKGEASAEVRRSRGGVVTRLRSSSWARASASSGRVSRRSRRPRWRAPGGGGACMAMSPTEWTYTSQGEVKTFTAKNNGPDQSTVLVTGVFAGNASTSEFVLVQDNCRLKTLVVDDSCTMQVQHFGDAGAHHDSYVVAGSDNSQIDVNTGQRGDSAHLIGH